MVTTVLQRAVEEHYEKIYSQNSFISGVSRVPFSGKVFDEEELMNGVEAVLDGWWTIDR